MRLRAIRVAVATLTLAAALVAGSRPTGPLPPLGPLLDPTRGAWAAVSDGDLPRDASAVVPGLSAEVRVVYDDRAVPHIFARSADDAYRALGYVVARDRLLQLELQALAASGRLTELAGARALPLDREMRELGMGRTAERRMAALDPASATARALAAYADGVNAFVDSLDDSRIPVEYRLLGQRPSRWAPVNSVHLLNRMSWTLSYTEHDLAMAEVRARIGDAAADALFPVNSPIQEPIVPNGQTAARFDPVRLPPPGAPDSGALRLALALAAALGPARREPTGDALGSNNWAVAPARSASGHALLAGDPHLELTLPSIWYEAHLVVPGALDVAGVTIPGAPWIVIGFNRDVAWSFTNAEADLVDYYEEVVDHLERPARYRVDGVWRSLEVREERYHDQQRRVIATDTVRYTHRGPLRRAGGRWLSTRWTMYEPADPGTFGLLAAATSTAAALEAMATYAVPPQNMIVADRHGSIAIRTTGLFPVRPAERGGRGDVVRDGSRSASDWTGFLPLKRYPTAMDPAQGYLASANQQPRDPVVDPAYLGSDWYSPWRAMRINTLLRGDSSVTPDEMRRFQTDPGSARAEVFVPALLEAAERRTDGGEGDDELREAARLLGQWDRRYTLGNERALLFEQVMTTLAAETWDELNSPGLAPGERLPVPEAAILAALLRDERNAWWDSRATADVTEDRDAMLVRALRLGYRHVLANFGPPANGKWHWRRHRHANIHHLLRLGGFSALRIPVQGGPGTLSPSSGSGTHGASWRMVVELGGGDFMRAWGIYPGGQSGNPGSRRYTDRLDRWALGMLDTLRLPAAVDALPPSQRSAALTLRPAP